MYYIYHIPGTKIDVSTEPEFRVKAQGYDSYEILEQHTDIHEVSNREQELQRQYGYPVDSVSYWISYQNQLARASFDSRSKGGMIAGAKNIESGHLASLRTKEHQSYAASCVPKEKRGNGARSQNAILRTCPHCGFQGKAIGYYRYHENNCKKKGSNKLPFLSLVFNVIQLR